MRVQGAVSPPGDKSISHRVLILAALARGRSNIGGILTSADVQATAAVLRSLGAELPPLSPALGIEGRGGRRPALAAPAAGLECGNSGTTARLVAGIVAAHPFAARFTGDASLSRRPMRRIARPLERMGASVTLEQGDGLPMTVRGGALRPIEWVNETASAQVKSAILLAALGAGVEATVHEPRRSRDHTERLLQALGVPLTITAAHTVQLREAPSGGHVLPPLELQVPGDPSSAAFFAALAALAPAGEIELPNTLVNDTRMGFLRALVRMGGRVRMEHLTMAMGEPVGVIHSAAAPLHGIRIDADHVPALIDELPLLACVAARAEGATEITGAGELRAKESDRIATVVGNLRALGAEVEELADGLLVVGSDRPLRGRVVTHGDHRIAMAFGVLSALPGNVIEIDDPACVAVSYPAFWKELARVVGG